MTSVSESEAGPSTPDIHLVHASANPRRVVAFLRNQRIQSRGQDVRWLYLGRNFLQLMSWEQSLGPGYERVRYAEELQELAMRWRRPYLDWIAALGLQNDNLVWWSSRVAERNTLLDSLYHQICYLQTAVSYIQHSSPGTPLLVLAESRALLRTIALRPELRSRVKWIASTGHWRDLMNWAGRLLLTWTHDLIDGIRAMEDARATRGSKSLARNVDRPRVLIHSCMNDSYFGADGSPHDRYFTLLPDELRKRGYDVVTVPWLYNLSRSRREAFSWFNQQPERYVIPEDWYTWTDYLWAASIVIRQAWLLPGSQVFEGLDITKLVRDACLVQSLDTGVAKFVRYSRLVRRWKQRNFELDIFVDMFENMVGEKPPVIAFRKLMPNVTTVGFQHYMAPYPMWLCGSTTPADSAIAPHPDVIVCNSRWTAGILAKEGFPAAKLRIGPSLRYLYMGSEQARRIESENNMVLVVIPLETDAAAELMYRLLEAFPTPENIRFLLKPHPMMSGDQWKPLLNGRELASNMERVEGSLADCLARVSCAIVAASTSALEIALMGVPVVLVGRETDLEMNPLSWFSEFPEPVRSAEGLRKRLLQVQSLSEREREQLRLWAKNKRHECFSPLTEETIRAFVEGPAQSKQAGLSLKAQSRRP